MWVAPIRDGREHDGAARARAGSTRKPHNRTHFVINDFSAGRQGSIDASEASIAVLNAAGRIIAVNDGWILFGRANGRPDPESDLGRRYPYVEAEGIRDVIAGPEPDYSKVYPCHSPVEQRWFRLLAARVDHGWPGRCLVIHRRLDDAPTSEDISGTGEELGLRWQGIYKMCGWCEQQTRDPLGHWIPGQPEPGQNISHGLCSSCAFSLLEYPGLVTA
jgi:hypothetical protein